MITLLRKELSEWIDSKANKLRDSVIYPIMDLYTSVDNLNEIDTLNKICRSSLYVKFGEFKVWLSCIFDNISDIVEGKRR